MILKGTKFQLKVWKYLKKIPKGQIRTYSDVAKAINKPNSVIDFTSPSTISPIL